MPAPALTRHLVLPAAALAVAGALAAGVAPAAAAPAQTYVRAVRACAPATRTAATCHAMRLERTTRGAAGARPATARVGGLTYGPAGGYTPADLATAYGYDRTTATSVTVGVVDAYADPNVRADLTVFDKKYGFPAETATSLVVVNQRGKTSPLPTADAGWANEISLDVDTVRAACASCRIVLVETDSAAYSDLAAGVDTAVRRGATVVSNSYGGPEASSQTPAIAKSYNHPGVVITVSTGDDGWYDWDFVNTGGTAAAGPNFPSSLPDVVAVGGTSLLLNDDGTRSAETVWNGDGWNDADGYAVGRRLGASGGGCSTTYAAKPWQRAVAGWASQGCGTKRLAADISAVADPRTGLDVYDSYQAAGWATYGGTSLAAPLVASLWALAGGSGGVAYPAQTLYQHFGSDPIRPTYDVQVGGNALCDKTSAASCTGYWDGSPNVAFGDAVDCGFAAPPATTVVTRNGQCDAHAGYDGPSGVGTPIGLTTFVPTTS